jgi:acyl-CoA thioesterase-1
MNLRFDVGSSLIGALLCATMMLAVNGRQALAASEKVILVLGDSLSAGYGIEVQDGWVQLLDERLDESRRGYAVVNASISGDTTSGALARLADAMAAHRPAVVVVQLGGNDGLRGLSLEETRGNLAAIVRLVQGQGARALLVGIRLPPNYGKPFVARFEAIYRSVAEENGIPLVPFLLEGIALDPELMQADGIHPKREAQARMLDIVWPYLEPLL